MVAQRAEELAWFIVAFVGHLLAVLDVVTKVVVFERWEVFLESFYISDFIKSTNHPQRKFLVIWIIIEVNCGQGL